jgi:hypothetical protein
MILSAGAPNHNYVRLKRASPSLHLRPYSSDSSGIKNIILSFEIKLPFVTRPITQACHAKFIRQHIKSSATRSRSALERHVLLRLLEYWTQTPQSTLAARKKTAVFQTDADDGHCYFHEGCWRPIFARLNYVLPWLHLSLRGKDGSRTSRRSLSFSWHQSEHASPNLAVYLDQRSSICRMR